MSVKRRRGEDEIKPAGPPPPAPCEAPISEAVSEGEQQPLQKTLRGVKKKKGTDITVQSDSQFK